MPMPITRFPLNPHVLTVFLIVALLFPCESRGQVNKSNLTGVVRDSSGAPIPGVAIRAVNTATGATRQEVSDQSGLYRFILLDSGLYRLETELQGFKKFAQDRVQLATGETTTIDITLSVGDLSESVTVAAETPLLRTETGALGTTVSTEVLNDLPLIGRNPYVFLTLAPGIQYTGSPAALNPWDVCWTVFRTCGSTWSVSALRQTPFRKCAFRPTRTMPSSDILEPRS
jgi:Carboxypeptidase regulatory-like domain